MNAAKLELVRGSGNVFRDLDRESADIEQSKALLEAEIIKALDRDKLTVGAAHAQTGFAAADFSRIRNADLDRFTVDRLMSILNRLGSRVEVRIRVRPMEAVGAEAGDAKVFKKYSQMKLQMKREALAKLNRQANETGPGFGTAQGPAEPGFGTVEAKEQRKRWEPDR